MLEGGLLLTLVSFVQMNRFEYGIHVRFQHYSGDKNGFKTFDTYYCDHVLEPLYVLLYCKPKTGCLNLFFLLFLNLTISINRYNPVKPKMSQIRKVYIDVKQYFLYVSVIHYTSFMIIKNSSLKP